MLTPKIRLVLAILLATSSLVFVAIGLSAANAPKNVENPSCLKSKVLRLKDKMNDQLSAQEIDSLKSQASPEDERKFEDKIPKHVPIKFKLKAEKEKNSRTFTIHIGTAILS